VKVDEWGSRGYGKRRAYVCGHALGSGSLWTGEGHLCGENNGRGLVGRGLLS